MVSDRVGQTTGYALDKLQLSGQFFVNPGEQVYEGMVVGECAREDEMVVNAVRPKEKNNIRTHSHDDAVKLPDAEDPHPGDGDRVDRRRRAGRGHAEGDPHPQALPPAWKSAEKPTKKSAPNPHARRGRQNGPYGPYR